MFFANSRSRFKSRPKILLAYCLKTVCLIAFLVLLIAQLRTIAATNRPQAIQNFNETSPTTRLPINDVDSIDRHDRESTFDEPFPVTPTSPPMLNVSFQRNGADRTIDDLSVSPATRQVQQAPAPEETDDGGRKSHQMALQGYLKQLSSGQPSTSGAGPSLAQLTAAGTATGLLMNDLLAQANDMEDQLAYGRGAGADGDGDGDGDPNEAAAPDEPEVVQTKLINPYSSPLDENNQLEGGDNGRPDLSGPMQAAANYNQQQMDSQAQPDNNRLNEQAGGDSDPASEEAAPDSIESLMGAEGADLNQDEGSSSQAEPGDDGGQASLPVAGSNLIQNDQVPEAHQQFVPPQLQQQFLQPNSHNSAPNEDNEADDYPEEENGSSAQGSQMQEHHLRRDRFVPVISSTRLYQPYKGLAKYGSVQQLDGHSLVAPMRESLNDLNAAAGHYSYGKKKKKKVKKVKKKKIIIKKKKKKKKKYKKIKIVKIKKKKKKKVKKKKKHHHHHHHHHHSPSHGHGHGKYYMYAKVPKKKTWEFGFKKGNKKHWIERHEKGHKNKFKTKVKWYDKKSKGKGVHIWDYNHHDKKKKKHY